jgi:hypothetical protein
MPRWLFWCIMVPLYWAAVVHILRDVSPVFVDGGGPMPSFYWTERMPLPGLGEYYTNRIHFDRVYSIPYYVAGFILTVLGCGLAPQIAKRRTKSTWRIFVIASGAIVTLLILVSAISDAGGRMGWWYGPRILLMHSLSDYDPVILTKAFLHPSILSGIVAISAALIEVRDL